jgi:hypothetical protein
VPLQKSTLLLFGNALKRDEMNEASVLFFCFCFFYRERERYICVYFLFVFAVLVTSLVVVTGPKERRYVSLLVRLDDHDS